MGLKNLFHKVAVLDDGQHPVITLKDLREWLDELHLIDVVNTSVQLDELFERMSHVETYDSHYGQCLDLFHDPLSSLNTLAYQKFTEDFTSSREARRAQLHFLNHLNERYANLTYQFLLETWDTLDKGLLMRIAHHTMCSYVEMMVRRGQLSLVLPENFWSNSYQLYSWLQEKPPTIFGFAVNGSHIELIEEPINLYISMVILSAINPYQLGPARINELFHFFRDAVTQEVLVYQPSENALIYFDPDSTEPPKHVRNSRPSSSNLVFIDVEKVLSLIQDKEDLSRETMDFIINTLRATDQRRYERHEGLGELQLISGIGSGFDVLYDTAKVHKELIHQVSEGSKALFRYNDNLGTRHAWQTIIQSYQTARNTLTSDHTAGTMTWHIINQSSNGMRLMSQEPYPVRDLAVGQYIYLNNFASDTWLSGLVRWMSIMDDGVISIGIELIARENKAVLLQNTRQKEDGFHTLAILGKYTYQSWREDPILILPAMSYIVGEPLMMFLDNHKFEITLTRCLEDNNSCKLVAFENSTGFFE